MKKKKKYFYCYNTRLEDFLAKRGIHPVFYNINDEAAYEKTNELHKALDSFWIQNNIFKL
jgi:hypothetical protein